jgi:hypothetical protein
MPARASRRATLLLAVAATCSTLLAIGLVACGLPPLSAQATPVPGQGDVVSEDRTTTAFRHISVGAGIKVVVGTGGDTSVTLSAQQNLIKLITTEVRDDQLVVQVTAPGVTSTLPITLTISVPELDSITLSAGATGILEDVGGPLTVDVSAGSAMKAIGQVESLKVTASSGAVATLGELLAGSAVVNLTGGSSAQMHVTGAVTGTADAGSTLVLTEKAGSVDVKTSGGATVQGG